MVRGRGQVLWLDPCSISEYTVIFYPRWHKAPNEPDEFEKGAGLTKKRKSEKLPKKGETQPLDPTSKVPLAILVPAIRSLIKDIEQLLDAILHL